MPDSKKQRSELEAAIEGLEAQRSSLGESVAGPAIAALRQQIAQLDQAMEDAVLEERKLVTVVFADIAGFTALSETKDAEDVRSMMNECFDHLVPVVHRYEGTIDKFIGDQIMALFGAPVAHEDDSERALRASLEMMQAIRRFNDGHGTDLALHIGVNTGPVVAGKIGAQDRRDYSVMGDAVNLAARLEDASEIGEILVGPTTYRQTARLFDFEALEPQRLKGKSEPVQVYRLLGIAAAPDRDRGIKGLCATMMGREKEIAAVRAAMLNLSGARGGIIALLGDAGVGKSRLILEMKTFASAQTRWAEARALPFTTGTSYWLAREFLCSLVAVDGAAPPAQMEQALRGALAALDGKVAEKIRPFLARLLDLPLDAREAERFHVFNPQTLRTLTLDAYVTFVAAFASQQLLVAVWEDLHWCDPSSLEVLSALLPLVKSRSLLVACVSRREENPALGTLAQAEEKYPEAFQRLELVPLSREESVSLIRELLRVTDLPEIVGRGIVDRAEGNPFFLEELVRSLMDAGIILAEGDRVTVTREISAMDIPDTIQAVLAARIDRLQPSHKQTLHNASVIGRTFQYPLLARLSGADANAAEKLADALAELLRREFVELDSDGGPHAISDYTFKHAITHSVAYESIMIARRVELHRAVAEAMEYLFADRLVENSAALAFHYERGNDPAKALRYFTIAAERAEANYANAEAAAFYKAALLQIDRSKGAKEGDPQLGARLNEHLGDMLELQGRHEEALTAFRTGGEIADPNDRIQRARLLRKTGFSISGQREFTKAAEQYDAAEAELGGLSENSAREWWEEKLQLQLERMFLLYWNGEAEQMRALADRYRSAVEEFANPTQYGRFFQLLALSLLTGSRYRPSLECLELAKKAVSQSRGPSFLRDQAHFVFVVGLVQFCRQDYKACIAECMTALDLAEKSGDLLVAVRCVTYLAAGYRGAGDRENARKRAEQAHSLAEKLKMTEYVAMSDATLSWVAWAESDYEKARTLGMEALELWHRMEDPYGVDWMALWPLIAISFAENQLPQALQRMRQLFGPNQHPLPDELATAAKDAIEASTTNDEPVIRAAVIGALEKAHAIGHLRRPRTA